MSILSAWVRRNGVLTLAAVHMVMWGGCAAMGGAGAMPSATRPAQDADIAARKFIERLPQPYMKKPNVDWEVYFDSMKRMGVYDIRKRDQKVPELVRAVAAAPNRRDLRVLILENVNGDFSKRYWFVGVCVVFDPAGGKPPSLPDVESLDPARWKGLEPWVEQFMKTGGGNNGLEAMLPFNNPDATVITYFDGKQWRGGTWFNLSRRDLRAAMPRSAEDLEPDARLFLKIMERLLDKLKPYDLFGGNEYWGMVTLYGDPEYVGRVESWKLRRDEP